MLPFIAIPVIHSSGAWIASTATAGYLSGSLSTSWIGAFILGNSGLLSSLGLISAGGFFGAAATTISGIGSTATAIAAKSLTAVGLAGTASSLGLAPTLFLGLTPVGWSILAGTSVSAASLAVYLKASVMRKINDERRKGGLSEIGVFELVSEIKQHEYESKLEILKKLSKERLNFKVNVKEGKIVIEKNEYKISAIRYVVEETGKEFLQLVHKVYPNKEIFLINEPNEI